MKTIKEIADFLKIDKQKVYRYIRQNHINEAHQKSGVMYYDEAVESEIISHFTKIATSTEVHQNHIKSTSSDMVIDVLVNMLKQELEVKNEQIEKLQEQLETERMYSREQAGQLTFILAQNQKLTAEAQRLTDNAQILPVP